MKNEIEYRIDPLTGEKFIPKKISQKFANAANRIKFNNKKASKLNQARAFFDKPCKLSHSTLKLLFDPNSDNIYNIHFVEGKGVDYKAYNHIIRHRAYGNLCAYYEFAIRIIPNTDNIQIIKI